MGIKITSLPVVSLPYSGSEQIALVQSGTTKVGNLSSLTGYLSGALLTDSELAALSGNWQSTSTTVRANSANWQTSTIGLNTSPYDALIQYPSKTEYFSDIPFILFDNGDFALTSDGQVNAPEFGAWVWAGYETFPEQPTIYAYTVQYWFDQYLTHRWVQYTDIPAETLPSGVYEPFDGEVWSPIYVVVKDQQILDNYRFVTDNIALWVNLQQTLSGAPNATWRSIGTGALVTP